MDPGASSTAGRRGGGEAGRRGGGAAGRRGGGEAGRRGGGEAGRRGGGEAGRRGGGEAGRRGGAATRPPTCVSPIRNGGAEGCNPLRLPFTYHALIAAHHEVTRALSRPFD